MAFVAERAGLTASTAPADGFQQVRMPPLPAAWKAVKSAAVVTVPVAYRYWYVAVGEVPDQPETPARHTPAPVDKTYYFFFD